MNRICELFNIKYPIVQGGMVWCSGWRLASAVSNAGGLGLIGAGSMNPELLREHIQKTKSATDKPFGVNIPLLFSEAEAMMKVIIDENVKVVFTSAGNPAAWTKILQENGIKVAHVVANTKFAKKAEDAGVDALVAEGFEAGGHNGREETTTLTLIPHVRQIVDIPLIAAGGIATGRGMLAAMALGAEGVQMGTRFVAAEESSAHQNFKNEIVKTIEGSTYFAMKKLFPVRLIKNEFCERIIQAEIEGKNKETISELLGRGRAKQGMFDGDISEGELEIGQISALIQDIKPVREIIEEVIKEYHMALKEFSKSNYKFE
jgi:enoyl-[acyl-carrier protein] reductase II